MANVFFEQKKTCPVCQKIFTITRVRSSACYVVKREPDFNVIYRDVNPVHYAVWVCPHCQFAAPDKQFSEELRPVELDRLKKGLMVLRSEEPDFSGERSPEVALRSMELAIRTAQLRQSGPGYKASLYLRCAWVCRELGLEETETEFLKEALTFYRESFEREVNLASRLSDVRLMYIIGELNRKLDNYDEAIQWFSRAVMNRDIKKEPELERQLRDQWDIAREQRKQAPEDDAHNIAEEANQTLTEEKTGETSATGTEHKVTTPKPRHRNKVKLFASVYSDQVDWLKSISNICHDKTRILVEKETVLRAALDALIEISPEIEGADCEETLKQQFKEALQKK